MHLYYHLYITISRFIFCLFCFTFLTSLPVNGQSGRYWAQALNEESSMLAGAVVGGGAGNSAIYFNPANIAEAANSKFSFNADLFSLDFYNIRNALGEGLHLKRSNFNVQPRFISFLFTSKKIEALKYQIAALSRENYRLQMAQTEDRIMDILTYLPGEERYFGNFRIDKRYSDYWVGAGGSYGLSRGFSVGASMFVSIKSLHNEQVQDITAHPQSDTIFGGPQPVPFYSAIYYFNEFVRYNNYRLVWKLGVAYKTDNFGLGINITTPSVLLWADGKTVIRNLRQQNIMNPDGQEFLPNYNISDAQYRENVSANHKEPWSVALGFTYRKAESNHSFFSTVEYFHKINPYRIVEARENPNVILPQRTRNYPDNEWLTIVSGARSIVNVAFGYQWEVSDHILLLGGFKTDFSYAKKLDLNELESLNQYKNLDLDVYHLTTGARFDLWGHTLFAGLQYAFGVERNMPYLINMADPVEYSESEKAALQGPRLKRMSVSYNGLSFYFGATFNFGNQTRDE